MFETAELGRKLTKEAFAEREAALRTALLEVQRELEGHDFPVIVVVNGVDASGKGECVNRLHEWLDARYLHTTAFGPPTDEEAQRPPFWRFWMSLPPRGRIGVVMGSWYSDPILERVHGEIGDGKLEQAIQRIARFEQTLADDGALIVKLWFHLSKKEQKKRLDDLASRKETRWRVTKEERQNHELYDTFTHVVERVIRETSTGAAPWTVIESTDPRYRDITVGETLLAAIRHRLAHPTARAAPATESPVADPQTILDTLDLRRKVEDDGYEAELLSLQGRLNRLARKAAKKPLGVTLVFEGADAAGKGGAIRRLTAAMDARQYRVIPIAAPTDEERARHYLWRFWRHLPRLGRFTLYDRSWYGRVLVERVEGFCGEDDWRRAYREIVQFEQELVDHGIVLVKCWLHISQAEQLARFEEREKIAWKKHKITAEDYRNRAKAPAYEVSANDMIARTSTEFAPWTLVEAEDKRYARLKVLKTVCDAIERAL